MILCAFRLYRWSTLLLFLVLLTGPAVAEIIPDNRLAPWQGNVGVPGGIPTTRATIFKNIVSDLGADPTGATDCSAIIQNALQTCPQNQVVYIPEGTFKIAALVYMRPPSRSNRTLRGAGMGRTILKLTDGVDHVIEVGNSGGNGGPWQHAITAGATKGSNSITVDNTTNFVPGALISIQPANPTWEHRLSNDFNYNSLRNITVTFKVRSKTSTTVTFDPPCPFDFSGMNPVAVAYDTNPSTVCMPVVGFGIEDLTFDLTGTHAFCAVKFTRTWGCWLKNTEIKGAYSRHVYCDTAVRCEFRGLYHHDFQGSGSNHEGLDFITGCCWNLVEDSIFGPNGGAPPIILGDGGGGCTGNVFGYNYCFGNSSTGYYDISLNHGAHNMLNLVEGNVIQVYQDDGYFGSCSHNTLFRNKITDQLRLKHMSTYYSIVGNVLGNGSQTLYETDVPNYWQTGFPFYELGYPNAGNPSYTGEIAATDPPDYHLEAWHLQDNVPAGSGPGMQELDRNVEATIIRHGNFDTVHNGVVWDDNIPDHTIPPSLYYSSTPSWWPEGVAWPPMGPDLTPMASQIPAQIRYATMSAPVGGLRILP